MITKRNYLTMVTMIFILLFMMLFSVVIKTQFKGGLENDFYSLEGKAFTEEKLFSSEIKDFGKLPKEAQYVLYIGDSEDTLAAAVDGFCQYNRWYFMQETALQEATIAKNHKPYMAVLSGACVQDTQDIAILEQWTDWGIHIVFTSLPDNELIRKQESLRKLLGIREILYEDYELTAIHLFEGFLLGGEVIYENPEKSHKNQESEDRNDFSMTADWYETDFGVKYYMIGEIEDSTVKSEKLPPLIWRKQYGNSFVFCFNGDLLQNMETVGYLSSVVAQTQRYYIYPVINAQNFVLVNYFSLANENSQELLKRYNQQTLRLESDVLWPNLIALTERTGFVITSMGTPQLDYKDENLPQNTYLPEYFQLLREREAELGISAIGEDDTLSAGQKLKNDEEFWSSNLPEFHFQSVVLRTAGELSELSGIKQAKDFKTAAIMERDKLLPVSMKDSWTIQNQGALINQYTYREDLYNRAMQTALAYSNVCVDMSTVLNPKEEEDSWHRFSKRIFSDLATYWKAFDAFDKTTLSQSDIRIRNFYGLNYSTEYGDYMARLDVTGEGSRYFILRTNGDDIRSVEGGGYVKIEPGAYLIEALEDHVYIELTAQKGFYYNRVIQ